MKGRLANLRATTEGWSNPGSHSVANSTLASSKGSLSNIVASRVRSTTNSHSHRGLHRHMVAAAAMADLAVRGAAAEDLAVVDIVAADLAEADIAAVAEAMAAVEGTN